MKKEIKETLRETNPGLHALYVRWAIKHLLSIRKCINELSSHSNCNMMDSISALYKEYNKLTKNNAAYEEAHEIITVDIVSFIKEEYTTIDTNL